jgi:acyl-CoA synthetase (AMP-forming)/AMP-acid ligase II
MYAGWGAVVRSCYCASETGAVTFNGATDVDAVRDSVGTLLAGVSLRIEDVTAAGAAAGPSPAAGRIVVGGDLLPIGYRDRSGVAPFQSGVVTTADVGWLDGAGRLHLVGRVDDRINVGSETVDPGVVEAQIGALDGVEECLVVARPHPRLGSVLEARIVRGPGTALSERDVIAHCRARGLAGAWSPWAVTWVESIPKTAAGKPVRCGEPV